MRRWVGQLAPVAAAGALVWLLGATFPWVLIWWSAVSLVFLLGWIVGHAAGERKAADQCQRWQDQCDAFEAELTHAEAQLAKRDQAIVDLQHNIGVVWDAGVMAGQTFQADRQENDL